ncbi:ATP-dependent RNA helicase dbp10 [Bachmanniomyces sp. S44760]|nr:ATP-dependent RNA helicase dbp10 [Bachmanniomyces sp. S44760]
MPHRAPSPASSENEVDISHSLFADSNSSESEDGRGTQHPDRRARMLGGDMPALGLESESDDAEFIAATQAASNRKTSNVKGQSVKKGGGFQAMGLNTHLLKAITRKGFSVPTPIQRKTVPLVLDGQDVVGMARTGSGKTAAFVIPMIEKLKAHSVKVGARALVLSPSRELALQTLKVVKELGKGTDLSCVLLVGGDSLEEQFGFMAGNPDIVIATPGRFLHLKVEMGLDLSSIRYVVFDEADRLFEMGFATQLTEILYALPQSRQTLLFSATLPKSLVEFARAGLQEPNLVRLDAESKISPDLESAFFTVKSADKEGALLHILNDVIKIPTGKTEAANRQILDAGKKGNKRKHWEISGFKPQESPTAQSTIIFTATKHHVEYLATLLRLSGFAVSHAYGSLDQTARKMQVQDFRNGMTNILVVTDVAARGIDIPILANVINYDFPPQPKIFVHRVGRTARAGQRGWSYSLVRESDVPYLLDLQLFLGKPLLLGRSTSESISYSDDIVLGSLGKEGLERNCEWVARVLDEDSDLFASKSVAIKGEKLYLKTRNSASSASAKRSKETLSSRKWVELHPLFNDDTDHADVEREKMLARVSLFRPAETVFEIGKRGTSGETAEIMKRRRDAIESKRRKETFDRADEVEIKHRPSAAQPAVGEENVELKLEPGADEVEDFDVGYTSEEDLEITISQAKDEKPHQDTGSWKDAEHFMSYTPSSINLAEDRGYGVHSGSYNTASQNSNFVSAAKGVTMDLTNDDGMKASGNDRAQTTRWDKKNKKYVARANDEDGSKGARLVRGESGQKIAASFRSGRFDAWRKFNKMERLPRTGEAEKPYNNDSTSNGRRFKHKVEKAPKEADKFRDDYYKKKKLVNAAKEKRIGRYKEGKGKNELKGLNDVTKERSAKEKRKQKNNRPSRKKV